MRVPISRLIRLLSIPASFGAVAIALAAVPEANASPEPAAPPPPPAPTAAATCAECHQEVVSGFETSSHGRAWRHGDKYGEASCATCHGDGAKHAESGEAGGRST